MFSNLISKSTYVVIIALNIITPLLAKFVCYQGHLEEIRTPGIWHDTTDVLDEHMHR